MFSYKLWRDSLRITCNTNYLFVAINFVLRDLNEPTKEKLIAVFIKRNKTKTKNG
jgi:hypothetical protein